MDRFSICLQNTLEQECPFPNDWNNQKNFCIDDGGPTMCGLTQSELNDWTKKYGLPAANVRYIPEATGKQIYRVSYWEPHCPMLPPGADMQVFDTNVNEGVGEGIKILQFALGAPVDGVWGPQTAAAVAAIKDVAAVVKAFTDRRIAVYHETKDFDEYGKDWVGRATTIGAVSLAMCETQSPSPPVAKHGDETPFEKFIDGLRNF